jgi:hypothetical protein
MKGSRAGAARTLGLRRIAGWSPDPDVCWGPRPAATGLYPYKPTASLSRTLPGGFLDFFGQMASAIGAAPGPAHVRIWEELRPWLGNLSVRGATKWLPYLGMGLRCEVSALSEGRAIGCDRSAIGACDVCGNACCLGHARIDQFGDAICFVCITAAIKTNGRRPIPPNQRQHAPPIGKQGPTYEQLALARKILKVKVGAEWSEIEGSYKSLLRKYHPDRQRTPEKKADAEAKFKAVRAAYDLLKSTQEKAA